MHPLLLLVLVCVACSQGDNELEADSASSANAIKARFARVKAIAESTDRAEKDSLARIARQHADSEYAIAYAAIRKLPPDSIDSLPPNVLLSLRQTGCVIPQPIENKITNAVKGAFTAKGAREWAVLCAFKTFSKVLVIAAETGAVLDSLDVNIDNAIGTVSEKALVRIAAEEGGGPPQRIDHDGIDIAILEKASVAWYYAGGTWYQILTSD